MSFAGSQTTEMESRNLQSFIEDAENLLPMIRSAILLCSQERNSAGELETLLRYTGALKEAAFSNNLPEIGQIADSLGEEISGIAAARQILSNEQTRHLLDKLAQIEARLAKIHFSAEDFPVNLDGFVEESFDNLWHAQTHEVETQAESGAEAELEGFEIDEEMLEVFGIEAEELLDRIGSHLEILESTPNDREALLEIRRSAHTLKGSAGIIGLKPLSTLAHRVEDLLDFLSENRIEGNRRIFELLSASTGCLRALATGEDSAQLIGQIGLLYQNYDVTLSALQAGKEAGQRKKEKSASRPPRAPLPEKTAAAETRAVETAGEEAKTKEESQPQKAVIRVSLEKLDELGRLVSDLIITRSVFEQRLAELDRQIGELQHSTERLKRSTGKLETDFEASTLSLPSSRFQLPNLSSAYASTIEFDALEFDYYTEFHQMTRELLEATGDASGVNSELDNLRGNLELLFDSQYRLIEEMQDKLLRLRMIQFGTLAPRLHRTVSVTCEEENKRAELLIEGEQTEIDTQILNSLAEPLLHLLRNAVAHGIEAPDTRRLLGKPEKGRIILRLQSEGTHVVLKVTDDGRGFSASALKEKALQNKSITPAEAAKMTDEQAFALSFLPGVTTAETVSQTAGRGVGMNIIKTSLARQQGTITIASEPQKGTTFTIRLPMTLAVTRGLLVRANGQIFAFPLKLIKQVTEISAAQLAGLTDLNRLRINEVDYALSHLETLLGWPVSTAKRENIPLLLFENSETPYALMIEEIIKAEEIVIKPLGAPLKSFPYLLGATILGDGRVVPVLDIIYLLKNKVQSPKSKVRSSGDDQESTAKEPPNSAFGLPHAAFLKVMIVDDSPSVRHITSKLVKKAGFEVVLAKDGLDALEILLQADRLPHVVLTDVEMPRMDGYELLAALKNEALLKAIPVVMITSRASAKHRQKALELGVSEYLTKPFNDSVLIETIEQLAGHQGTKL